MAEANEMAIHELSPVVRMEGDHLPRIPAETRLKGSDHIDLCFRPDSTSLGPSRTPIRDGQGPVEVSHCLSSIMPHQVHARAPGISREAPLGYSNILGGRIHTGLNGDPATQGSAPGMRDAMQEISLAFSSKEPPDGGRTHLEEESSGLLIDREMPMGDQVRSCGWGRPAAFPRRA